MAIRRLDRPILQPTSHAKTHAIVAWHKGCPYRHWPMTMRRISTSSAHTHATPRNRERRPDRLSAHQGLDDNHRRTTVWAGMGRLHGIGCGITGVFLIIGVRRQVQQLPYSCQIVPTPGIGDQAAMTDAVKASRQHVQAESSA
jgi:hypothetical protein